jgi:hypothetical protein
MSSPHSHTTGFEWCLGLLKKTVHVDNYRRNEEHRPFDHSSKFVRFLDASGRNVPHLPDAMGFKPEELTDSVDLWYSEEQRRSSPRHFYVGVLVMWLPKHAFAVREERGGRKVRILLLSLSQAVHH